MVVHIKLRFAVYIYNLEISEVKKEESGLCVQFIN